MVQRGKIHTLCTIVVCEWSQDVREVTGYAAIVHNNQQVNYLFLLGNLDFS
jgi:uncharacterized protein YlbG (UPF0298 family)